MCNDSCKFLAVKAANFVYIIAHGILIIFIIANMIIVSIKLPKGNLILFLILFFLTIILSILGGILICYVQRKSTAIQPKIKILTIIGLITTIIFLILTIVEEIIMSIDYSKIKQNKCFTEKILTEGLDEENINVGDCINSYLTNTMKNYSYFTLTFIEIISIISIIYWIQNKKQHADQPIQTTQTVNNVQGVVVPNSAVVVSQVPINNAYMVSPGQQIYQNVYPQQGAILYNKNQVLYYNNNNQGQLYIQGNNNQNLYYNNQSAQYVQINNNNLANNNINGNNIANHALNENIKNENSSYRQVNNKE
jgi:hypothetical protein